MKSVRAAFMSSSSAAAVALVALLPIAPLPAAAAATDRVLHVAFETAETGFDPQALNDNYSYMVCDAIFDALYTYDYFARPPHLIPNTAAGMPQITDGGRTFTIKVTPGIYFADDPAFKGKRRELTADDYVYSFKRIFDPRVRSTSLFIFEHQLAGLDEALEISARGAVILLAIDIAQCCRKRYAMPFEIAQRVGKRMRARPAHVGERRQHTRGTAQANEPIAAVGGAPEHRIAIAEQAKGASDIAWLDRRNVAADDDRRPRRQAPEQALHPHREVAAPLRHALDPLRPIRRGHFAVGRHSEKRAPARIAAEPQQRVRKASPVEPRC